MLVNPFEGIPLEVGAAIFDYTPSVCLQIMNKRIRNIAMILIQSRTGKLINAYPPLLAVYKSFPEETSPLIIFNKIVLLVQDECYRYCISSFPRIEHSSSPKDEMFFNVEFAIDLAHEAQLIEVRKKEVQSNYSRCVANLISETLNVDPFNVEKETEEASKERLRSLGDHPGYQGVEIFNSSEKASLSDKRLCNFPSELFRFTNLTELTFKSQGAPLPAQISTLTRLNKIEMCLNGIKEVPEQISSLTKLVHLDFACNRINKITSRIGDLVNLTCLKLSSNIVPVLPNELCALTNLKSLLINYNRLQTLPHDIGNLMKLEALDVKGNRLDKLPPSFSQLTSLTTLDLSKNKLSAFPAELYSLFNLNLLEISDGKITSISSAITQMSALGTLFLDKNLLTDLPPEISTLTKLNTLVLTSNQFRTVPTCLFQLNSCTLYIEKNLMQYTTSDIDQLKSKKNKVYYKS